MNGGTCIDGVDNFTCSCPPRLTGPLCECLIFDDGTYDCEYVSPTPLPEITQSVILTTMYEDLLTTDTSVIYTIGHNDTKPRNMTMNMLEETEMSTLSTPSGITTPTDTPIETTPEPELTKETTHEETTAVATVEFTTAKEMTSVTSFSQGMDSKTETTTECQESCVKSTEYTAKLPPIGQETSPALTTELTKADTKLTTTSEISEQTTTMSTTEAASTTTTTETPIKEITAEVTTTPKGDTTTEKMFTDTPTEHALTDYPTPPVYTTTEAMEASTGFDNTTYAYTTTVQSECTDSICNNHGTCINTPHGIRVSILPDSPSLLTYHS